MPWSVIWLRRERRCRLDLLLWTSCLSFFLIALKRRPSVLTSVGGISLSLLFPFLVVDNKLKPRMSFGKHLWNYDCMAALHMRTSPVRAIKRSLLVVLKYRDARRSRALTQRQGALKGTVDVGKEGVTETIVEQREGTSPSHLPSFSLDNGNLDSSHFATRSSNV